jgi:hypothetical protein
VTALGQLPAGAKGAASGTAGTVARAGTGIVIDTQGYVLTDNHVVSACGGLRVTGTDGASASAKLVAADAANDLALLQVSRHWSTSADFQASHGLRPGEPVVVTGFPLSGLVSQEMAVSTGSLTALGGLRGDIRQIQISAPVQSGNSGSPVMDERGHVIGVTSSVLNGMMVAMATGGAIPENVNFAIKTDVVRQFLETQRMPLQSGIARTPMSAASVADLARGFTVKIECMR